MAIWVGIFRGRSFVSGEFIVGVDTT